MTSRHLAGQKVEIEFRFGKFQRVFKSPFSSRYRPGSFVPCRDCHAGLYLLVCVSAQFRNFEILNFERPPLEEFRLLWDEKYCRNHSKFEI